jgi:hypothetical protein
VRVHALFTRAGWELHAPWRHRERMNELSIIAGALLVLVGLVGFQPRSVP